MGWVQLPAVQLGAVGILFLVLLTVTGLIFSGRLMPRRTASEIRAVLDARIKDKTAEAAEWRTAWTAAEETTRALAGQIGDLLELARASEQLLRSLQQEPTPRGRADVASP